MNEREIFTNALKRDPADREAYLVQACGGDRALRQRVDVLLAEHAQLGSFLESPAPALAKTVDEPPHAPGPGAKIGPYKLLEKIAEGGMGVVYMAAQTHPVERKVALKLIKPGLDTHQVLSRFDAERQALALMDHPNIAKVFDAGTTETGQPYFVMELVHGVPITDYCDTHRLTPRERLELFHPVCMAVQHAHQKGIIHRDLKPSNVMVAQYDGKPVPKVIDFGVAKATGPKLTDRTLYTGFGTVVGTLEYMSPEQAVQNQLDIDTRSDIYSLGVMLYELLTGTTPLDHKRAKKAALLELLRIIKEEEPPKPSTRLSSTDELPSIAANRSLDPKRLSLLVRGDLDWIVMKALEKDRTRRYETANGLARDLNRYLHDEPVEACPPSALYRFRKFARRNRLPFTAATLVLLAIVLGAVVSTAEAIRATRAERLAEERLQAETEARNDAETAREAAEQARQTEAAQRQVAESQRLEATRQRDKATKQLYVSQLNLAQRAWDENNVGRVSEILESLVPGRTGGVDLRGWEWHYLWRLSHSERRRLIFPNSASALCVGFSADGRFFVTGLDDGTLKAYSADGTREIWSVKAHTDRVNSLAFQRDGRVFATTSSDQTAKLWETATGRELRSFPSPMTRLYDVALSADGGRLALADGNKVEIFDTASGAVRTLEGHTDWVASLAFSPDGHQLFSGSRDGTAAMWDLSTGRKVRKFQGRNSCQIAVSPDGRLFVVRWDDGRMKSWDLKTGLELAEWQGHQNGLGKIAFSRDGARLASVSNDTTVKLWDPANGREIQTLRGHASVARDVAFSASGDVIASAAWDHTVRFWDASSRQEPWTQSHPGTVVSVQFARDGRLLAAGSTRAVAVWDLSTGQKLWTESEGLALRYLRNSPQVATNNGLVFDPTSRILAVGTSNGEIHFRDAREGTLLRTIRAHTGAVMSLDYTSDGRILASAGSDRLIALWNPVDGRRIALLKGHTDTVLNVAFSPDGRFLASAGDEGDHVVRLWDISTGQQVRAFVGHEGAIRCVIFSRDGRQLITGSVDEMIRIWDVESGRPMGAHRGHAGTVHCLSLSPDGRRLASCGDDQTVTIWDLATRQELQTLKPKAGSTFSVAFSPAGGRLAAGSEQKVTVWDARPLTADVRTELVAADLLRGLIPRVNSEEQLLRLVRDRSSIDESVRDSALEMARSIWRPTFVSRLADAARVHHDLANSLRDARRMDESESHYRQALVHYDALVADSPSHPEYQLQRSFCHNDFATMLKSAGRPAESEREYRCALALFEKLAAESPHADNFRLELGHALWQLGYRAADAGRFEEAEKYHRRALSVFEKLAADFPQNVYFRQEQGFSDWNVGGLLRSTGRLSAAEASFREALAIYTKLSTDFPDNQDYRARMAQSYQNVSDVLRLEGKQADRGKILRDSVNVLEKAGDREGMAAALEELAELDKSAGQISDAIDARLKAVAVREKLAAKANDRGDRWRLGGAYEQLADLLIQEKKTKEAESDLQKAVAVWEKLAAETNERDHRWHLAGADERLAGLLKQTSRAEEARDLYVKAGVLWERLVREDPKNGDYSTHLQWNRSWLAEIDAAGPDRQNAEATVRASVALFERLAAEFPPGETFRLGLGHTLWQLGYRAADAGRFEEAEKHQRRALTVFEKLSADFPQNRFYRFEQGFSDWNIAELFRRQNRLSEAAESYRNALRVYSKLAAEAPNEAGYREREAVSRLNLAGVLVLLGRSKEAEQQYAKILEANPKSASAHNNLAWMLATSADTKQRDPARAVELARKAVEFEPKQGMWWNTLGVAQYRAGDFKEAVEALKKSMELRHSGDGFDWIFLGMAEWELGNKDEARKWYDKAVEWMDKNKPDDAELKRFRAEAGDLFNSKPNSGAKAKEPDKAPK